MARNKKKNKNPRVEGTLTRIVSNSLFIVDEDKEVRVSARTKFSGVAVGPTGLIVGQQVKAVGHRNRHKDFVADKINLTAPDGPEPEEPVDPEDETPVPTPPAEPEPQPTPPAPDDSEQESPSEEETPPAEEEETPTDSEGGTDGDEEESSQEEGTEEENASS